MAWCAGTAVAAPAAPRDYQLGPAAGWVESRSPAEPADVPVAQVSRGVYYLLSDMQVRIDGATRSQYKHVAAKALNAQGVAAIANFTIDFDPSYQTLTLHALNVRRAGRVTSQLDAAAIRVLRREKELEAQIFDGTKTASVVLDDVRVGDVVEYAFTLRGSNPVFGHRSFGWMDLQWGVPVHRLFARLVVPSDRDVHLAHHNTGVQPSVQTHGSEREYRWELSDVAPLVVDDDAPGWYDPYPYAQWSEFGDWAAVARWAVPLYRTPAPLSAALQAEVDAVARAHSRSGDRLLAVLRFVQREIRYLGVEIGAGSHAPSSPNDVLQRRFGDCKDKSLLTITMLRALGIEAQPALVNTRRGQALQLLHPTPGAFNHVIVHATLDGRAYWVDPTLDPQKGTLDDLYEPHYGHALLIDGATRELTAMPDRAGTVARRKVHALLDSSGGVDAPMRYTVVTVHEGASAESIRGVMASRNREELQKAYQNFYARAFAGIEVEAPFAVVEDPVLNRVTVTERYRVPGYWKSTTGSKRRDAEVAVPDLEDLLRSPRERLRSAPLAMKHPVDLSHTTEVLLPPGPWTLAPETAQVSDPAFELTRKVELVGRRLVLADRYVSRRDHVAAADMPGYLANLQRARDIVDYSLTTDRPAPAAAAPAGGQHFNWTVGLLVLLLVGPFVGLARKIHGYDPPPGRGPADESLNGISGWLLLPALGLAVAPMRLLWTLYDKASAYGLEHWYDLTAPGGAGYHPLWAPALLWELATNLALTVFLVLLGVLFVRRRSSLPRLFIAVFGAAFGAHAITALLLAQMPGPGSAQATYGGQLAGELLGLLLWGSYFAVSRRVRSTFIERLAPAPEKLPQVEEPPLRAAA